MIASPEATAVRSFLARAHRRLVWIAAVQGAAAGLLAAAAVSMVISLARPGTGWLPHLLVAAFCAGIAAVLVSRHIRSPARLVESRVPESRNLILTADELIDRPARVPAFIAARVYRDAARVAGTLDPGALFPARSALLAISLTAAVWLGSTLMLVAGPAPLASAPGAARSSSAISSIDITVTPPAYSRRPTQRAQNPARIEALAGSRITIAVRATADSVALETLAGRIDLASSSARTFQGVVTADADGYIAVEAGVRGASAARRLIGLTVIPDRPPQVKVTAPGRDLLLPDANRSIAVAIEASDDLALASLSLRYTKVSGSGEQFTFTEGEVPAALTRVDDRTWRAQGALSLSTLALQPGDLVVYRGAARDRRPGATAAESDAFIIEITAPGAVAAEGFAIDDERDRYALSQQMVIVKTERLIARAAALPADSVLHEAMTLAAEQRSVRAEFVFMMGGELAEEVLEAAGLGDLNEEAHVAADDEAIAGRLANQGRLALVLAIRSMSRASTALNAADLTGALTAEKAALDQLQRAFSRTRYILRALTQRERLDLSRRLSGELEGLSRVTRPRLEPEITAQSVALRRVLADLAAHAAGSDRLDAEAISRWAQQILQIDPSAEALRSIASTLDDAAEASATGQNQVARAQLDRAATLLAAAIRADLTDAPRPASSAGASRLEGALVDALRRRLPQ